MALKQFSKILKIEYLVKNLQIFICDMPTPMSFSFYYAKYSFDVDTHFCNFGLQSVRFYSLNSFVRICVQNIDAIAQTQMYCNTNLEMRRKNLGCL